MGRLPEGQPSVRIYVAQSIISKATGFEPNIVHPYEKLLEQTGPTYKMQAGTGNKSSDKEAAAIQARNQYRAAVEDVTEHPETDPKAARATLQANLQKAETAKKIADAASQSQE